MNTLFVIFYKSVKREVVINLYTYVYTKWYVMKCICTRALVILSDLVVHVNLIDRLLTTTSQRVKVSSLSCNPYNYLVPSLSPSLSLSPPSLPPPLCLCLSLSLSLSLITVLPPIVILFSSLLSIFDIPFQSQWFPRRGWVFLKSACLIPLCSGGWFFVGY